MVKISISATFALFLIVVGLAKAEGHNSRNSNLSLSYYALQQDTTKKIASKDSLQVDTIGQMVRAAQQFKSVRDTINVRNSATVPNISLQQIIKGNLAGVYVQETNGEPGTEQSIIVQGASNLLFSKRDNYALQPAIYLNGVPLVGENPFAFDIQRYDFNRIGPATNLLSQIDIDNIQSIAVIKDAFELAKLGPNAANGAIYITTKNARSGKRDISLNSYFGYVTAPGANTINGAYENKFRKPFFDKYATPENYANSASYLRDSTNTAYFGPSNWNDSYYNSTPTFSADLGITGGNDRANFRFFGSGTKNSGNADNTSLDRYNLFFGINMAPFTWLSVSSTVNAARLDRTRNKSLRDRFAESRYIPDLSSPLSPNASIYSNFLAETDKDVDDNKSSVVNGNLTLRINAGPVIVSSSLMVDYNEGIRDYFVPSTLQAGASYISNYFGFSQRVAINNTAEYTYKINDDNKLDFGLGQSLQGDTYRYNYARAYDGPNDFVKLISVEGDPTNGNYLNTYAKYNFYIFRYSDRQRNNLFSANAAVKYSYKDLLTLSAIVRRDGSSNGQPDSRWATTSAFNAVYNLKSQFLKNAKDIDALSISAGWGRTLRIFQDDKFAAGPQYKSENGWFDEPTIPGYGSVLGINRPYNSGFVGYGITLPFADRTNVSVSGSFLKGKLNGSLSVYNREDRNQVIGVPVPVETGYSQNYKSGLDINNKGVELSVNAFVLDNPKALSWSTTINTNYNRNKVTGLPDGLQEVVLGDEKITVGRPIGSYWLYTNQGIYNNQSEIPAGRNFNGIPVKVGDPNWKDYNGDNRIDLSDKVSMGDRLPKFTGGWSNSLTYKNFDLNLNLIFAVGQKAINQYDARRYGFVNTESGSDIASVREISSWQTFDNEKTYPIYNPWSAVDSYRTDQDLFLEDASYLKLRSATLGYDFGKTNLFKKNGKGFRRAFLYVTAMNLFTVTKFSGQDPELINYTGVYDGANITIPKTFVLGFKLDL